MNTATRHFLAPALLLITIIVGAWQVYVAYTKPVLNQDKLHATVFSAPRLIEPFAFTDHNGSPFTEQSFKENWSFVFFGFTNCPDVCPNTLTVMNVIANGLASKEPGKTVPRFIMISVDPQRDTVEQLSKYIPYFNKAFIGLTAANQQDVDALTKQFGIPYAINKKSPTDTDYDVQHSGAILLVNPAGNLHAITSAPHDAQRIIDEFSLIRSVYEY